MSDQRLAWIDATAGVAGDMLMGALLDAGASLERVRTAVDAVVPGSVQISVRPVTRAGQRATKAEVEPLVDDPPHRTWVTIQELLADAELTADVRDRAWATFARLAAAEARVHGVEPGYVHFHEVGALDSIADVVGVCAAVVDLGIDRMVVSEIALGSGAVRGSHGEIPVPVPAVVELSPGWPVLSGGPHELTTPTGMALVTTLCGEAGDLPAMTVQRVGIGAGSRDPAGRANVTRVLIGTARAAGAPTEPSLLLEANVDDLDPRLWPGVLADLLSAGAADAWLVPIQMKKGRPAHVLSVLGRPDQGGALREVMISRTSTFGVREHPVARYMLPRRWVEARLPAGTVTVKIAHRDGTVLQVTPEFDAVARYAREHGCLEHQVLADALQAAAGLGYRAGDPLPAPAGPEPTRA